jgi:MFS family permease
LRVIDRIGKGVREAPRDVIISVSATNGDTGRSFGYHRAMDAAGGILGPLLAYFLLTQFPGQWGIFFLTAFVIGLIAVGTIFFVREVVVAKDSNGSRLFSWNMISTFPTPFRLYLLSIFILAMGSLPTAVLLLKTTSLGVAIASIPLFYMVYSLSFTMFSYSAGRLSDKIGTARVLFIGYIILIISYIGMAWAESIFALACFYAIMGIYSACTDSTQRSYVALSTEEYHRGTAYGLYNAVVGFGAMVSGIVGGLVWQIFGADYAMLVAGIVVMVGLAVFFFAKKKVRVNLV